MQVSDLNTKKYLRDISTEIIQLRFDHWEEAYLRNWGDCVCRDCREIRKRAEFHLPTTRTPQNVSSDSFSAVFSVEEQHEMYPRMKRFLKKKQDEYRQ